MYGRDSTQSPWRLSRSLYYRAWMQVYYNPQETDYDKLLDCFFEHVDPTTVNRQGNDMGTQYRSGIYYHNEEQKAGAEKVWHGLQQAAHCTVLRELYAHIASRHRSSLLILPVHCSLHHATCLSKCLASPSKSQSALVLSTADHFSMSGCPECYLFL